MVELLRSRRGDLPPAGKHDWETRTVYIVLTAGLVPSQLPRGRSRRQAR